MIAILCTFILFFLLFTAHVFPIFNQGPSQLIACIGECGAGVVSRKFGEEINPGKILRGLGVEWLVGETSVGIR